MRKLYIICGLTLLFAACKPSVHISIPPTAGRANFSNYLAIGNSLTSGYSDNSLTVSGQLNSYPERLFEQFQLIPGINGGSKSYFVQPLLHSDNGYPGPKKVLGSVYNICNADSTLGPIDYPNFVQDAQDAVRNTWPNANYNNGQINNIGVPGIRIIDYPVSGYGGMNPYSARFYHNVAGTPFDELNYRVNNLHPSFFTLWLGANDVLGYATNGGKGDGTGYAAPAVGNVYNSYDITPFQLFYKYYDSAVRVATSTGATGALINIPDITSLPFFTVIPSNGLVITRQSLADSLNQYWISVPNKRAFQVGANQYMVKDHNNNIKQSIPGELILMTVPMGASPCSNMGSFTPIDNIYVLTTEELQMIHTAITNFNNFIYTESRLYNLAYVDMNQYLKTVYTGVEYNGISYNASYVTGGAFSLDGVHLTQRGYALVANQIITTIDSFYKATISLVDVNKYQGVLFP